MTQPLSLSLQLSPEVLRVALFVRGSRKGWEVKEVLETQRRFPRRAPLAAYHGPPAGPAETPMARITTPRPPSLSLGFVSPSFRLCLGVFFFVLFCRRFVVFAARRRRRPRRWPSIKLSRADWTRAAAAKGFRGLRRLLSFVTSRCFSPALRRREIGVGVIPGGPSWGQFFFSTLVPLVAPCGISHGWVALQIKPHLFE